MATRAERIEYLVMKGVLPPGSNEQTHPPLPAPWEESPPRAVALQASPPPGKESWFQTGARAPQPLRARAGLIAPDASCFEGPHGEQNKPAVLKPAALDRCHAACF